MKRLFKIIGFLLATAVMTSFIIMVTMFFKGSSEITLKNNDTGQTDKVYEPALTQAFNGEDSPNGTNILILGSDRRITETSGDARTDTIMVLNISREGKLTLTSFMRDTLVNIPSVSAEGQNVKLNTAFNLGENNGHQGAELMRQTLKDTYGIRIKYYAMLDFETFAKAIDSLFPEGVTINAKFGTVDGQEVLSVDVPDDLNRDEQGNIPEQTIYVGKQQMDGRTLLNYARFRKDDDVDFGRVQRQQQVVNAIAKQLKNPARLFTGSKALGEAFSLTSSNVPYSFVLKTGLKTLTTDRKVHRMTVPEQGDWVDAYDIYGGQGLQVDTDFYADVLDVKKLN